MLRVAAVALSVAGCASAPPAEQPSSSSPAPSATAAPSAPPSPVVPATRSVRWVDLQPGDCLTDPPPQDPSVVQVTVIDCAAPHAAEVFGRTGLKVNTALADVADAACSAEFAGYTGASLAGSGYSVTYLIDSDQNRRADVAEPSALICVLSDPAGATLTGSAAR
ncbi:hypothetical protein H7I02_00575 [Mycolicibacterium brumae]|uniref:Septum formation-related domain-containing protein n=1 Tax=Mycolicibacterium brumae TaxID=85968 RepID=A0A2G5P8C1_9MYCO|nr:hypothetical protein [Mycolicibacterium brumae]PIB74592.1 hypothetical protein CQY22_012855 [Mycolicibacterium brumae]